MAYKLVMTIEKSGKFYSAVPAKWETNKILRWPQHLSTINLDKLRADPNSAPSKNWTYSECVVKAIANTFVEARQLEIQFTNFTDTEAEELHLQQLQQNKRYRKRAVFTSNDLNFNEMFDVTTATSNSSIPYLNTSNELQEFEQQQDSNNEQQQQMIVDIESEININQLLTVFQDNVGDILEKIRSFEIKFEKLDGLEKSIAEINVKLDKLLQNSSKELGVVLAEDINNKFMQDIKFPLQHTRDVENLNLKCSDQEFRAELTSHLARIGGTSKTADAGKIIYKLVDYLFDPELMIKFSWTGSSKSTEEKLCFQKYYCIVDVIFDVLFMADCRHSKSRNEEYLRDKILKHSLQRLERKRKIEAKHQNLPNNEN